MGPYWVNGTSVMRNREGLCGIVLLRVSMGRRRVVRGRVRWGVHMEWGCGKPL